MSPLSLQSKKLESSFQWIFEGNLVVPTGNPFQGGSNGNDDDDDDKEESTSSTSSSSNSSSSSSRIIHLNEKLHIKVDYVLCVDHHGIIAVIEPSTTFWDKYKYAATSSTTECDTYISTDSSIETLKQNHPGYVNLNDCSSSSSSSFLCPGLVDLHIHAPQYAFCGTGTDRPLMGPDGWLETYTFPAEAALKDDRQRTRVVYDAVVKRTLDFGTTTAMYFATTAVDPTKTLVDTAIRRGQRALIGKVSMDRNAPDHYIQSAQQNIEGTKEIIEYIESHPDPKQQPNVNNSKTTNSSSTTTTPSTTLLPLVLPTVIPRFIPTCTPELLEGLGQIVQQRQKENKPIWVTSHVSESNDEVEFAQQLIRQDYASSDDNNDDVTTTLTDTQVFDKHNLLTDRCVLAHGVLLSEQDFELLAQRGAAVGHCPLSNFYFAGHALPTHHMSSLNTKTTPTTKGSSGGVKVGLGTDVAAGYSPSIMDSARTAILASISLKQQQEGQQRILDQQEQQHPTKKKAKKLNTADPTLDYRHSFYLATLGGANALNLQSSIGSLQVGMEFDAMILGSAPVPDQQQQPSSLSSSSSSSSSQQVIDSVIKNNPGGRYCCSVPDMFEYDTIEDRFQKLWMLGDDRNVRQVFVQGRRVKTLL